MLFKLEVCLCIIQIGACAALLPPANYRTRPQTRQKALKEGKTKDASSQLKMTPQKGSWSWYTEVCLRGCAGYAFMSRMSGPYRSCNDQTLRSLHARRHKRTACARLAGEHTGAGEEEGGEGEAINEPPHIFRKAHLFEFSCYSLCFWRWGGRSL